MLISNTDRVGSPLTSLLPRSAADALSKTYELEKIIASYEYDQMYSGLDFPQAFADADPETDIIVRFYLYSNYGSTSYLDLVLEADGVLATSHWFYYDSFQQSTSAYSDNGATSQFIRLARTGANEIWSGEIIFHGQRNASTDASGTYQGAITSRVNTLTRVSTYSASHAYGGVQSQPDAKITGFRLLANNQFGNDSYQLGKKPGWVHPGWLTISQRLRVPTS